jgi:hypothetical protein
MDKIKPIPLDKLAKGLGPIDKIKYGITYLRLSRSDIQEMKDELKSETISIINSLNEPKLNIIDTMSGFIEDYIDSLSKKDTFKLYLAYLEVKEAIGLAQEQYSKLNFLLRMYQNYRKSGWTFKEHKKVKKVVKSVNKIKNAPAVKKAAKAISSKKASLKKKIEPAKKEKSGEKKKVSIKIVAKKPATIIKKAPAKKKSSAKKSASKKK